VTTTLADYQLDGDALFGIANQVWTAYLDMDGSQPLVRAADADPTDVVASISVTGGWDGHVVIGCSSGAAAAIAAAMLALPVDEVTGADILDAIGELVNVVGGNVKSMLPGSSVLSLPRTASGGGGHPRYPGTRRVGTTTGTWQGEPVTITVLQIDLT
jgi:chemotaxis protein CheX